jgi:hypothetical protein
MAGKFEKNSAVKCCVLTAALLLLAGLWLLPLRAARCDPVSGPEYEVKAGFIYNFAKFVSWPQQAYEKSPGFLVLCFVSNDPSVDVFYKLEGKIIWGRKIKVVAYQGGACLEQSQILFFATQDKALIQQVLGLAKGRSILTIGEVEGFTQWGGVINFFQAQNRLRFKINIDAARREGLRMSSQLLGSAQIVKEGQE